MLPIWEDNTVPCLRCFSVSVYLLIVYLLSGNVMCKWPSEKTMIRNSNKINILRLQMYVY